MIEILVTALPYLIAVAAALAGNYLTGFVQDKWSKRGAK